MMRPHASHIPYYDEKTPLSSQVPQPTYNGSELGTQFPGLQAMDALQFEKLAI